MTSFHSAVNFGRLGDGPDEPDLYFMMDWDRMKESVCRTPRVHLEILCSRKSLQSDKRAKS